MKCKESGCSGDIEINFTIGILIGGQYHPKVHHCKVCMRLHFPDHTPVEHHGKKAFLGPSGHITFKGDKPEG